MTPQVSIVAPAFNAAAFFDSWIASIEAQQYPSLEVLLVDDGSTDNLAAKARTGPAWLQYIHQDNAGPSKARNRAIALSRAPYVAFLDLDDHWAPGHLHRCIAALEANPEAGIAQGLIRNVLTAAGRLTYCSRPYRFLNLGAAIFRKSVFEQIGAFQEHMRYAEDFDLFTRCWEQGIEKLNLDSISLLYHRHDSNMTNGKSFVELGAIRVYKLHLDRVRAGKASANAGERLKIGFPQYIGQTIQPHDEGLREPVEFPYLELVR